MNDGARSCRILILCVGNPLMGDDGVGNTVRETLEAEWALPDGVRLMDGGVWGLQLLPDVEEATHLLIVDAIDGGSEPGTLLTLDGDAIPAYLERRLSAHEIGVADVLAVTDLCGTRPPILRAVGIQPERVAWAEGLSPVVRDAVPALVELVISTLREWGAGCGKREGIGA